MDIYDEIKNERYRLVSPKDYAKNLKDLFFKNVSLWYERIIPASKAEELIKATDGDYSQIWDDHCAVCFKPIDKNTTERFYLSEDELTWICESCFNEIQKQTV